MTSWGEASGSQAGEGSATGSQSGRQGLGDRRGVQRQAGSQTGEDEADFRPSGRGRWPFSHLTVLNWPLLFSGLYSHKAICALATVGSCTYHTNMILLRLSHTQIIKYIKE
jgi:hypothetical protein